MKQPSKFRVSAKAKGNKVPSIKLTQLTKPCACLILAPICFLSSSSGYLIAFFRNFRIACDARTTQSLTVPLEMPIAHPIFWRDASFP